jgi:hypothetical protein
MEYLVECDQLSCRVFFPSLFPKSCQNGNKREKYINPQKQRKWERRKSNKNNEQGRSTEIQKKPVISN